MISRRPLSVFDKGDFLLFVFDCPAANALVLGGDLVNLPGVTKYKPGALFSMQRARLRGYFVYYRTVANTLFLVVPPELVEFARRYKPAAPNAL
jgi:hypothetical protein